MMDGREKVRLCAVLALCWMLAADTHAADTRVADAAQRQDRAAVQALLRAKADGNAPQPDGATALAWAAHWDDLAMADLLLRAGAKVDAANRHGLSALSLAYHQLF